MFSDGDQLIAAYLASDEEVDWRTTDSEVSQESSLMKLISQVSGIDSLLACGLPNQN